MTAPNSVEQTEDAKISLTWPQRTLIAFGALLALTFFGAAFTNLATAEHTRPHEVSAEIFQTSFAVGILFVLALYFGLFDPRD